MAWIRRVKKKDGAIVFWVHDIRAGKTITIAECHSENAAQLHREQYEIRRSLELEGYFDRYEQVADDVFGKRK